MLLTKRIVSCILILVRWIQRFEIENARVAQLVEHDLAKVGAAGSSPVSCSLKPLKKQGFLCLRTEEMLDFTVFLPFFVSNLLLVQR